MIIVYGMTVLALFWMTQMFGMLILFIACEGFGMRCNKHTVYGCIGSGFVLALTVLLIFGHSLH